MSPEKMEEVALKVIDAYKMKGLKAQRLCFNIDIFDGRFVTRVPTLGCCAISALAMGEKVASWFRTDATFETASIVIGYPLTWSFISGFDNVAAPTLVCGEPTVHIEQYTLGQYVAKRITEEGLWIEGGTW